MSRPQNSARGEHAKKKFTLAGSGEFWASDYSTSAKALDFNSTGGVFAGGVKISNKQTLTGNSTGIVFGDPASSLPGNVDNGVLFGLISNSTGVTAFINTTGTTHKYLNVTTKQPT